MTNLGKLFNSRRFWLIVLTAVFNTCNSIQPLVSPDWTTLINVAIAVVGAVLTVISPIKAEATK